MRVGDSPPRRAGYSRVGEVAWRYVQSWLRSGRWQTAQQFAVGVALAEETRENCNDECWPSESRLGRRLCLSAKQVGRIARELEKLGQVAILSRAGRQNGHRYRLLFVSQDIRVVTPRCESADTDVRTSSGASADIGASSADTGVRGVRTPVSPEPSKRTIFEPSARARAGERTRADEEDEPMTAEQLAEVREKFSAVARSKGWKSA